MGAWIGSGSRDEAAEVNGISHFVEHMVFKGTTSRSAQQIAREVDTIGGNLDAFTGKEMVCFNIKVLDENVAPALDVLADLVLHPTFTPEELAREQGVILEEIKMDEDNPDYLVNEILTQNFWKGDALGRPILGTAKTVSSFNQQVRVRFLCGPVYAAEYGVLGGGKPGARCVCGAGGAGVQFAGCQWRMRCRRWMLRWRRRTLR